jgi:nicotinamide mononucleotide adenylyltransferase
MSTNDQDNFLKLSIKGFANMAKDVSKFDKPLEKLAKDAAAQGKRGYLTFMNWFQKLNNGDKLALAGELSYYTKQKDKTIEKMLKYKFESVELKTFNQLNEAKDKGVTFTYGRFNPPTVGHMKLAAKMKSISKGHDVHIYTSHTTDKKKNPLTNKQIRQFMNPMLPSGIDVQKTDAKTVFDVITNIYKKGYEDIQMVVGSDRIIEFDKLIKKYNGIKARHGYYKFKSIKVVSAGERDPDSDGVDGMSASKMRQLVHMNDKETFLKSLPNGYKLGKQLYKAVQKGMGLSEDIFPDFMYEIYNPQKHEWGTDAGREYAQTMTPGQSTVSFLKTRTEQEVPKKVLVDKEKFYKELKKERGDFEKDYGSKADSIMHATAMNMAKRKHGIN